MSNDATEIEKEAREKWNKEADEYNQWQELGKDEKDELISELMKQKSMR